MLCSSGHWKSEHVISVIMGTEIVKLILANIPLWMLLIAFLLTLVKWLRFREPVARTLLIYLLIFPIGVSGLWAGVFHALFPEIAAAAIGWQTSPFQFEVAMANLGVGIGALIAAWYFNFGLALGIIIVETVFMWGAAFGHVRQIVEAHNFALDNAGPMLWTDILIPALSLYAAWAAHDWGAAWNYRSKTPQVISVLRRKLKPGKSFEDFQTQHLPPVASRKTGFGYNAHYFLAPTRVINCVNLFDSDEIISIGMTYGSPEEILREVVSKKEIEQARHGQIEQVSEKLGASEIYFVASDNNYGGSRYKQDRLMRVTAEVTQAFKKLMGK